MIIIALIISLLYGYGTCQNLDADDASFVFAIFREASRNPSDADKFMSHPAFGGHFRQDEPWKRGSGRLNKLGKQQAYAFGQFLRRRYAKLFINSNDDILDFEVAKTYSSSISCTQATMLFVLAGLFPITDNEVSWNNVNITGLWQPYPYTVNDRLTASINASCPELKKHLDILKDDSTSAAQQWLSDDHRISTLFTERTGLNASLKHLSEFADFLQALQSINVTLPSWLLEVDKSSSVDSSQFINQTTFANSTTLPPIPNDEWLTKFLRYRNAHGQLCSNMTDCRRLMAGYLLNNILEAMMLKREDKLQKRKMHLYSVRPETLASLAALFQVRNSGDGHQPMSLGPLSGLLIEYRDQPQPSVRILSHELVASGDGDGTARLLINLLDTAYCPKQDWCRLDVLIRSVGLDTFDDWDKACKPTDLPSLLCPTGGTNIALVRDALTEHDSAVPGENGKKLKSTECAFEWDKSGARPCKNWASHGYCNLYDSVRWLFCRRTCLCNPEFL